MSYEDPPQSKLFYIGINIDKRIRKVVLYYLLATHSSPVARPPSVCPSASSFMTPLRKVQPKKSPTSPNVKRF